MNKRYITASELLKDSFSLAMKILESDFRPSFIIGVWRGGAPIGIAVQEVLDVCGVTTEHIAIRTSSYEGIDQRSKTVKVHGLAYVIDTIKAEDNLLIVDDVHDSGLSVAELIKQIKLRSGDSAPQSIKIATVYFKPSQSQVSSEPDYYLHTTNDWLVFPHELQGLTAEELLKNKPEVAHIIQQLQNFKSKNI
jgi:hypoxanthine phosphoribosyltransferase